MVNTEVSCNLFYVDDDRDDLETFKAAADSVGEDVCVFEFAELMLHTLHNPPPFPSIVFVDLNMPTLNGYDVIKEIKNSPSLCHLPLMVYSTTASLADVNRCKMLGASLFITKPTSIRGIAEAIKYVVGIDWHSGELPANFVYKG